MFTKTSNRHNKIVRSEERYDYESQEMERFYKGLWAALLVVVIVVVAAINYASILF